MDCFIGSYRVERRGAVRVTVILIVYGLRPRDMMDNAQKGLGTCLHFYLNFDLATLTLADNPGDLCPCCQQTGVQ